MLNWTPGCLSFYQHTIFISTSCRGSYLVVFLVVPGVRLLATRGRVDSFGGIAKQATFIGHSGTGQKGMKRTLCRTRLAIEEQPSSGITADI
jgi:hypothetical protein